MMYGFLDVNMKFTPLTAFDVHDHEIILRHLIKFPWPAQGKSLLKIIKQLLYKNQVHPSLAPVLETCKLYKQSSSMLTILLPHVLHCMWEGKYGLDRDLTLHLKQHIARLDIFRDHIPDDPLCYRAQLLECLQTVGGVSISGMMLEQLCKALHKALRQAMKQPHESPETVKTSWMHLSEKFGHAATTGKRHAHRLSAMWHTHLKTAQ